MNTDEKTFVYAPRLNRARLAMQHYVQMGERWNKDFVSAVELDGWGQVAPKL